MSLAFASLLPSYLASEVRRWSNMKSSCRLLEITLTLAVLVVLVSGCATTRRPAIPRSFDEALDMLETQLSPDERKRLLAMENEITYPVDFGNKGYFPPSWESREDKTFSRIFFRMGIYHFEDIGCIVGNALHRRVCGKPIKLQEMVDEFRRFWKTQDIVAPLDIRCPVCKEEMLDIRYWGDGITKSNPKRRCFYGFCSNRHHHLYYHKVGWKDMKDLDVYEKQLNRDIIKDLQQKK